MEGKMISKFSASKSGLFSKISDGNGNVFKLDKNSAFKIKIKDEKIIFYNKEIHTPPITSFEQNGNIVEAKTENGRIKLNTELGFVTPEFSDTLAGNLVLKNGDIYSVDYSCRTKDTGLRIPQDEQGNNNEIKVGHDRYLLIDSNGIKTICDDKMKKIFSLDNQNFDAHNLHCKTYNMSDKKIEVIATPTATYLVTNGQTIFKSNNNSELTILDTDNKLVSFDKETNVSTIFDFDSNSNSFIEKNKVEGKVEKFISTTKEELVVTKDENGKCGLVSLDGKIIIPHKYLSISQKAICHGATGWNFNSLDNVYQCKISNGDKTTIELFGPDGSQLLAGNIVDVDYDNSCLMDNGEYRFLAQLNNKTDYEYNWSVISNHGKVYAENLTRGNSWSWQKMPDGTKIKRFSVRERNKDNEKEHFLNVGAENVLAEQEDLQGIKEYKNSLSASDYYSEKQAKSQTKSPSSRSYSEDEKNYASICASILMGSPVAGIIVHSFMDDNEKSL